MGYTRPGNFLQFAIEAMALIEIVDLPNLKMGGFSSSQTVSLPEGKYLDTHESMLIWKLPLVHHHILLGKL